MGKYAESCREWKDEKSNKCFEPAMVILWGKFFPEDALGPRCLDCALNHISYSDLYGGQWAVTLLPDPETIKLVNIAPEVFRRAEQWIECEGLRFQEREDGTFDVIITNDIELARFVEASNAGTV